MPVEPMRLVTKGLALAAIAMAMSGGSAPPAAAEAAPIASVRKENLKLVRRFVRLVQEGRWSEAEDLMAPKITWTTQFKSSESSPGSYRIYLALADAKIGWVRSAACTSIDEAKVGCTFGRGPTVRGLVRALTESYVVEGGKIAKVIIDLPPEMQRTGD